MKEDKILKHDPLSEADSILSTSFYGRGKPAEAAPSEFQEERAPRRPRRRRAVKEKPTHYKIICISMYTKDIDNLDEMVAELKRRGHTKANKSQLIRIALNQLDLDALPPPQP